jgi:hypothetical protein
MVPAQNQPDQNCRQRPDPGSQPTLASLAAHGRPCLPGPRPCATHLDELVIRERGRRAPRRPRVVLNPNDGARLRPHPVGSRAARAEHRADLAPEDEQAGRGVVGRLHAAAGQLLAGGAVQGQE